jgi:hypothetical protein
MAGGAPSIDAEGRAVSRTGRTDDELDQLERELLIEQLKYYRSKNFEREREERYAEFCDFLTNSFGYATYRRRWGRG